MTSVRPASRAAAVVAAVALGTALGAGPAAHAQEDPSTRLFITPTGDTLPRGTGYVGTITVFCPILQAGITDRVSLGVAAPAFQALMLTPKVQVLRSGGVAASLGVLHVFGAGGSGGLAYGVVTARGSAGGLSVGASTAYSGAGAVAGPVMIGGELRVTPSWSVLTDNWIGPHGIGFFSAGIRMQGGRRTLDFGFVTFPRLNREHLLVIVPVLNFAYRF